MATVGASCKKSVKQGKRLTSQAKEIILNVYNYFDIKKSKGKGAFQRTLEATSKALVLECY